VEYTWKNITLKTHLFLFKDCMCIYRLISNNMGKYMGQYCI